MRYRVAQAERGGPRAYGERWTRADGCGRGSSRSKGQLGQRLSGNSWSRQGKAMWERHGPPPVEHHPGTMSLGFCICHAGRPLSAVQYQHGDSQRRWMPTRCRAQGRCSVSADLCGQLSAWSTQGCERRAGEGTWGILVCSVGCAEPFCKAEIFCQVPFPGRGHYMGG